MSKMLVYSRIKTCVWYIVNIVQYTHLLLIQLLNYHIWIDLSTE
jgi:hypothetical protein